VQARLLRLEYMTGMQVLLMEAMVASHPDPAALKAAWLRLCARSSVALLLAEIPSHETGKLFGYWSDVIDRYAKKEAE
jgi:hypothetical protein